MCGYDPTGWGLPYNYLLATDTTIEETVELALHVLLALLDFETPSAAVSSNGGGGAGGGGGGDDGAPAGTAIPKSGSTNFDLNNNANAFRFFAHALTEEADFDVILRALVRLLKHPHDAQRSYAAVCCLLWLVFVVGFVVGFGGWF